MGDYDGVGGGICFILFLVIWGFLFWPSESNLAGKWEEMNSSTEMIFYESGKLDILDSNGVSIYDTVEEPNHIAKWDAKKKENKSFLHVRIEADSVSFPFPWAAEYRIEKDRLILRPIEETQIHVFQRKNFDSTIPQERIHNLTLKIQSLWKKLLYTVLS